VLGDIRLSAVANKEDAAGSILTPRQIGRNVDTTEIGSAGSPRQEVMGRVDLGGPPPRSPTDPGVHVKCTRFVTLWNRCPSHDWVVSR
jgi:hypothetical protein